jgi:hypothetical protein
MDTSGAPRKSAPDFVFGFYMAVVGIPELCKALVYLGGSISSKTR